MTWTCRLVEKPVDLAKLEIGDMYFIEGVRDDLSDYYRAHNSGRPPLMVLLPGHNFFSIDSKCYGPIPGKPGEHGYYGGWTVTGVPPKITVHPSINMVGRYHGFLKDGVIGDPL